MAEFGWAYIAGGAITEAQGVTGSILLKKGDKQISGSANLTFDTTDNQLNVIGDISASVNISASAYYGDGSNLTGISSVSIANDGNNRILTADGDGTMSAESNLTFDGSTLILSGNMELSGTLYANEFVTNVTSKNVVNISATGSTTFGDTSDDTHTFVGSITGSKMNLTGLVAGTATTSSYLALDSSNNIVLTSSSGGSGGTIGAAEDGDYTDGLYTDFVTTTPVGTAIDRFNEVLKILAPSPAPALTEINYDNSAGVSAKLSFGASAAITDYTSSGTAAGFDAVDIGEIYESDTSGSNFRLGIYDGTTDITGFLNYSTVESVQNGYFSYSNDAFGNANEGTLKLELNGTVIHSVALSGLAGSGNPNSGSANSLTGDSGFTNISVTASSFDGNNSEWYIFKHRTAKFKIDINEQLTGWNYARVIHTIGSTDYETNYVEWINDPSGAVNDLSISNARIEDITTEGSVYLSGVKYNTQLTASYKGELNNIYRNVYPTGTPVTFNSTRATTPSAQALTDLTAGSNDETAFFPITGTFNLIGILNPSQTIGQGISVTHPLKANLVNQGSATATGFLIYDSTPPTTTNLIEPFINEDNRITSGSYDTQLSASSGTWDSEVHLTSSGLSGYNDGLVQIGTSQYSGRLYSPIASALPNSGDFSALANGDAGNPDYSSETGTRTYFRKIQNTSGATKYDMEISTTKNGTTFNNSALGTSNAHFYIKIPGVTGWMDISQNFTYGSITDGDGALINGASNDVDSGNNTHHITFGTASVAANEYVVIKMEADESWTGYLAQLQFTFGASAETAATPQVLSDIDANNTGTSAKLSFGTSNTISDYSNATGSSISLTDFDSNSLYSVSGDRRGIFSSTPIIAGEINDAIAADGGSDYPAKAFYNAYSGSLILEVNGTEVHSVNLESTLSAINSSNSNGSGLSVSSVSFSTTSDSIPDYNKPYRTGTYQVDEDDQNVGWNYARLIHRTSGDSVTNYVEWIVDPSGSVNDTAVSTPVLSDFDHSDVYYQSGIGYFASRPSASFAYTASNFYRNVYQNGTAISFPTTTNCSISNIRITGSGITTFDSAVSSTTMPSLNNTAGCETTSIEITGTVLFDSLTSISGGLALSANYIDYDVTVDGRVLHPFKSDRTTSAASKTSFMVYSGSIGSTNLNTQEYFNTEDYRIVSGNYTSQSSTTSSANAWNSQNSMNDGATYPAYNDGLVTVGGYAISPLKVGNAGDTRNNNEGSTGLQAPSGNPNYATAQLSESVRTYYRYFRNETGLAKPTFTVSLYGDANLISKSGAFYTGTLGANKNIQVELKVPFDPAYTGLDDTSTAWGDCVKPYELGTQPTSDGVGIFNGGGSDLDQTVDADGTDVAIQLQGSQVRDDQYFVLKISAHKDWTGYLSRIAITY